jgi:hypothetical protein
VSFIGASGIRHGVDVEADSLYEAAVKAIARFREDPWMEQVGNATSLDIEIRESATKHAVTLKQLEPARQHEHQPAYCVQEGPAQDAADEGIARAPDSPRFENRPTEPPSLVCPHCVHEVSLPADEPTPLHRDGEFRPKLVAFPCPLCELIRVDN